MLLTRTSTVVAAVAKLELAHVLASTSLQARADVVMQSLVDRERSSSA
jgi:hypothetical protein